MKRKTLFQVLSGPLLLTVLGIGALVMGCPNWRRPKCPRAGVHSCVNNQPHFCAPTGELTPSGDESCSEQGRVCAIDDAGIGYCARVQDSGLAADASEVGHGDQ